LADFSYRIQCVSAKDPSRFDFDHQFLHASKIRFGKIDGALSYLDGKTFEAPFSKDEVKVLSSLEKLP